MATNSRIAHGSGPLSQEEENTIERALMQASVTISNSQDVRNYLFSHPQVARTLEFVVGEARRQLGTGITLILEVDGSQGPGNEYLVLLVRLAEYEKKVLGAIQDLTRAARKRMSPPERRFVVTTDFVTAS